MKILIVIIFYLRIFILIKLLFLSNLNIPKENEIYTYLKFVNFEYTLLIFSNDKKNILNLFINICFLFWLLKIM
ncbi:hypothetical protein JCM16777_1246 [Leptotrichia wadei]|uniref:Uncharacterized protein n=1 Tax=Leptotrichia wadei TaxID=157687 RepID=A0A7U6LAT7_9FUSO|nr:hypothetical protein JCM16777_1246 [Leptotrichia wadei]